MEWFQLKQQKEERSKLLECLSKEKETVSQIEQENMQVIKDKEEAAQKYIQSDQALKEVSEVIKCILIKNKMTYF